MSDNKWNKPKNRPPQLFTGQKERDFVKQVNDEMQERIIGQRVLYFAIDSENTNYDPLYGEAEVKNFFDPVVVHARVFWEGMETTYEDSIGTDKMSTIEVRFQKRRISEDQNLRLREGDFILWGDTYYEIHSLNDDEELWGLAEDKFAVVANCMKARQGLFDGV